MTWSNILNINPKDMANSLNFYNNGGINQMEKEQTNKPSVGTWANLPTEDVERNPKVIFDVNITQKVVFMGEPKEYPSKEDPKSVFYVFDVQHEKQNKIIMTSAWTLLHELKKLSPLTGKVAEITKKLVKGKQFFEVKEIK
jgi:hypothetical protein